MKEPRDWIGSWGQHMKSVLFKLIPPHQKVDFSPSLSFMKCPNNIFLGKSFSWNVPNWPERSYVAKHAENGYKIWGRRVIFL